MFLHQNEVLLEEFGKTAFNKISMKHFDFLLCEKDTISIVAAGY